MHHGVLEVYLISLPNSRHLFWNDGIRVTISIIEKSESKDYE